jgi:gamma-glutamylcyclotransferase (GGCT)/AIG2-like uncharacterized protein YtfP
MSSREYLPLPTMSRKFLSEGSCLEADSTRPCYAFRKQHYFFYGTLMDPATLARVLNLRDHPILLSAKIIGYRCMLWGRYPALLDGPLGAPVHGMAFEIQSPKEVELLEAYEASRYKNTACRIELEDGTELIGRTFVWVDGMEELKERVFDLKDWQMDKLEHSLEAKRLA